MNGVNRRLFLFFWVLVLMILLVGGGYSVWNKYFSFNPTKVLEQAEQDYIAAMTADTYGGKTPQETLDMFVEALRTGDIELASKYFLLDENLSREEWVARLVDIENDGFLAQMIQDITTRSQPDLDNRIDENDFKFVLYAEDGRVGARINMQFNQLSEVWKIKSL